MRRAGDDDDDDEEEGIRRNEESDLAGSGRRGLAWELPSHSTGAVITYTRRLFL